MLVILHPQNFGKPYLSKVGLQSLASPSKQ